jgi:NADPH-dependent ferric siderophore reductase
MTTPATGSRPATAYRLFDVHVARRRRLSPSFIRFTFTGDDLDAFADNGFDQRIKLVLPLPKIGVALPDGDDWFTQWRLLPEDRRNPIRTYTVRSVRQAQREVDVDVVLHGEAGPASRWATHARPGDRLALLGPNAHFDGDCGGLEFDVSSSLRPLLLVGDETAVPAIASILEKLPREAQGEVVLEVPDLDDVLELAAPEAVAVTWLVRAGAAHGELLVPAVHAAAERLVGTAQQPASDDVADDVDAGAGLLWEVPDTGSGPTSGHLYAWLAGEAGVITSLRRHLVRELGVDRRAVAFMGYWKLGRAES